MSTLPAVTMQDLELEHADLLPRRETLTLSWRSPSLNVTQIVGNGNGNGNGNGSHNSNGNVGFLNLLNGSGDGNGSGDLNGDGNITIG
jgi:hypothetical protein